MSEIIDRLSAALAGRYRIEREIGAGGMASVYLARDLKHNRNVALKVLTPDLAAVIGTERFFSEIEVTANLHHPHLLPLFDSGAADGLLFYVMPYVEGETLRHRLDRERQLPISDALHIATAVASALDYAHRHGVIHRDLKPENILLHEREPLVMDFGIALAVSNAGGARVTQTGISLGTPQYMSPEQATGDRVIDARSDIYSLGAVLYEMLSGDPPHAGTTVQAVIARVLTDTPRSIRSSRETVPEHVEYAVMRALAKLPADRFETAAQFVDALATDTQYALARAAEGRDPAQVATRGAGLRSSFSPRTFALGGAGLVVAAALGSLGARVAHTSAPAQQAQFVVPVPDSFALLPIRAHRQVALSRDGARVAVSSGGLATRPISELQLGAVPGSDSAMSVGFSPDGRHLFYWSQSVEPSRRLMRIPVEGGNSIKIADSASSVSQASWGDGEQVIFRRGGQLILVSANGGAERVLANPDSGQLALGWPEFLPGGNAALITVERRGGLAQDSSYLGVVSLPGGTVADLGLRGFTPHYALGHLLYVDGAGQLFAVPFDAQRARLTGTPRVIAENVRLAITATDLAVSANGTVLYSDGGPAFVSGPTRRAIVMFDSKGRETQLEVPPRAYQDLRVSPDGERIALSAWEGTGSITIDVYLLHRATGRTERFTRNGQSAQPVWTRDGKQIVYAVRDPSRSPAVRFVSEPWDHSSPPVPFVGADGAEYLEPGPAGGYLAQVRGDSSTSGADTQIFIASMDSVAALRPFAASGMRERWPRLSPDGKWLAYHGHEILPGTGAPAGRGLTPAGRGYTTIVAGVPVSVASLYVSPVPGPGARIQISKSFGSAPMWARDGQTLYYIDNPTGVVGARGGVSVVAARLAGGRGAVSRTDTVFTLPVGPTRTVLSTASAISLGGADISPAGEFFFLRNLPAENASLVAPPPPRLIAIINWLGNKGRLTAMPGRPR